MNIGRENERTEFKRSTGELKEAVISICAILNKHGGGTLYFGADNDGNVIGQQIGSETLRDVSHKVYEQIDPVPNISVIVLNDGGREYIRADFDGKEAPYTAYGRYYMRAGEEDREMTKEQLRAFFYDVGNNADWEHALTEHTTDDVNDETLLSCYNEGVKSKRIIGELDKEHFLEKMGLSANGRLTNAGFLLLSKQRPILLKLAVFATNSRRTFLDMDHYRGNMIECIQKAQTYIKEHMNWRAEFSDLFRTDIPEVPVDAIREIVVNSFVHAWYGNRSTAHEIDITPDRIEMYNPGRLPRGVVPEEYLTGEKRSVLKNPVIAEFMFRCNMIEAFGTGFQKVISECREKKVDYAYRNDERGFTFRFFRPSHISEGTFFLMRECEFNVLKRLKEDGSMTAGQIAESIGKDRRTVFRKLNALKEKGIIERKGSDRGGGWVVLK
ncbi:MAG: putative DNA binding domain-containing protein [Methanomassiliicoccaceae archaeon]|nr:putative DNA binding domain-containing protein [Methanomassiliicoccaceae archaeon]